MSDARPPIDLPPTPKGLAQQMNSEIIPFKSTKINIKKSPLLFAVVALGGLTLLMFGHLSGFDQTGNTRPVFLFVLVAIIAILVSMFGFMYVYAKSDKPIWVFVFPVIVLAAILMTPLGGPFFYVFRTLLPGNFRPEMTSSAVQTFIAMLFGAGLMEELMKACPGLIGAWLALKSTQAKTGQLGGWSELLKVRGPLDGLLFGVAAGAMFIFLETGLQYSGGAILKSTNPAEIIGRLMLMIPRTMGGVVGHMAWAGITGYFIGLCVLRPQLPRTYLLYAWLAAAALHALWNTSGAGGLGDTPMYLSAAATTVLFVSCFLKAKQLDQSAGTSRESYGSIVVQPNDLLAKARAPIAPMRNAAAGSTASPAAAMPPVAAAANRFVLKLDGVNFALHSGQPVDIAGRLPGLAGIAADVTSHPNDPQLLGLRNQGATPWTVMMPNQSVQTVASQRNVRLVAGMRIEFTAGTIGHIAEGS